VTGVAGRDTVEESRSARFASSTRGAGLVREWRLRATERVKDRAAFGAINLIRLHLIGGDEGTS